MWQIEQLFLDTLVFKHCIHTLTDNEVEVYLIDETILTQCLTHVPYFVV